MCLAYQSGSTTADIYSFGNKSAPRGARPQQDFNVENFDSIVGPETGPLPKGASNVLDVNSAPLSGHYHMLPAGTQMPDGLDIIADGIDVIPNSPHGVGHHTIFPTRAMTVNEFNELYKSLPWQYGGKKMTNMYETWLMEQIHSIANFPYEDIKILDKYPLDVSKQVLKVLIENSCLGQNYGPIDISRKKINEINKDWLNQFLLEVASTCIDCSDEWEYRRLVELVVLVLPELKQEVLKLGAQSENEEVREVVEDFQNL